METYPNRNYSSDPNPICQSLGYEAPPHMKTLMPLLFDMFDKFEGPTRTPTLTQTLALRVMSLLRDMFDNFTFRRENDLFIIEPLL